MRRTKAILRGAAVTVSVLLAGGFIAYKAGAFDRFRQTASPTAQPSPEPPAQEVDFALFYSSKSAPIMTPPKSSPAPPNDAKQPTPVMGGSKYSVFEVWPNRRPGDAPAPKQP